MNNNSTGVVFGFRPSQGSLTLGWIAMDNNSMMRLIQIEYHGLYQQQNAVVSERKSIVTQTTVELE
jgi:hypothetical protein